MKELKMGLFFFFLVKTYMKKWRTTSIKTKERALESEKKSREELSERERRQR